MTPPGVLPSEVDDDITAVEELLDQDGPIVRGSTGQPRLNPALAELRQARLALVRPVAFSLWADQLAEDRYRDPGRPGLAAPFVILHLDDPVLLVRIGTVGPPQPNGHVALGQAAGDGVRRDELIRTENRPAEIAGALEAPTGPVDDLEVEVVRGRRPFVRTLSR